MGWSRRSWIEGAGLSNLGEIPWTPVSRFDIIMSQESRTCVSAATTFPRRYVVQRLVDKRAKYGESRCHSSGIAVIYEAPKKITMTTRTRTCGISVAPERESIPTRHFALTNIPGP